MFFPSYLNLFRNREHSGLGLLTEDDGQILERLPPEMELGNVEYKAKLVNPSSSRLQHLITQMKWRLREGQGEAIYEASKEFLDLYILGDVRIFQDEQIKLG